MSRCFLQSGIVFLFLLQIGLAQTGILSLQNVQLQDTVWTAEVYLKRTGSQPLYLTDCTLYLNIDSTKFGSPQLSFTSALPALYSPSTYVYTTLPNLPWIIAIDITFLSARPRTTNTVQISNSGNGTKLGTIRLTGFTQFTGSFAPQWRTSHPLKTVLYTYDPQSQTIVQINYTASAIPSVPLGPFFTLQLRNQQVVATQYTADIFIRRTGGTVFYLDTAFLRFRLDTTILTANSSIFFEDPASAQIEDYYQLSADRSGDTVTLHLAAPQTTSQSEFTQKIFLVPDTLFRLGSVRITNLRRGISVADMQSAWLPATSIVQRRRPAAPWYRSDDVTANGSWEVLPGAVTLTLTAPIIPDTVCTSSIDTVRWNVLNANAVEVAVVQLSPERSVVSVDTINAETGIFLWNVPYSMAGRSIRFLLTTLGSDPQHDSSALRFVGSAPVIVNQPQTAFVCPGDTAIFTVTVTGAPLPTIQWEVSNNGLYWGAILGETTPTLRIPNVQAAQDSLYYRARIENQCGTAYSATARLFLIHPVAIQAHPLPQTVCAGDTARFIVHATGTQPRFQWEYRSDNHGQWIPLPNGRDSLLLLANVPPAYDQRQYRVRIWNDCGDTIISQPALLTVYQPPAITLSLSSDTVAGCTGETVLVAASVTGTPPPSLTWEYSTDDGDTWQVAATNETTLTLPLQPHWHNRLYRLRATNTCGADTSTSFRLLVYTPPSIVHAPIDQSVCPGNPITFSVAVDGFPSPVLQWEYSTDTGKTWFPIPDSDTLQLSIDSVPADWNGILIRTIAYNQCGADTSASALLHVYTPPRLLSPPSDTTVCAGDTVIFIPIVLADPLPAYQWQLQLPDDDQWITLPGATSDTLRLPAVDFDQSGERYRLLILHPCDTVITAPATLTVVAPPQILQQPVSVETRVAKPATFTVVADTFARSYQWYRAGIPLQDGARIAGSTTPTLTITAVHPTDVSNNYYCVVSGECGSDTSRAVSLTVIVPGIAITEHPQDQVLCKGNIATFQVKAHPTEDSTILQYQWRRGAVALSDGGKYQGVTTPTLTIFNVDPSDAATNYNVQITAQPGGKTAYSKNAALIVNVPPVITQAPQSASLCAGETIVLEVRAEGTAPLRYQWSRNGEPLAQQTLPRLYLENLDSTDSGIYTCSVENDCGQTQSPPATIQVLEPPMLQHFPGDTTVTENDTLILRISARGSSPLRYHWFKNGQPFRSLDTNILRFAPIQRFDEGEYFCIVENACGSVQTPPFHISVTLTTIALPHPTSSAPVMTLGTDARLTLPPHPSHYPLTIRLFNLAGAVVFQQTIPSPLPALRLPIHSLPPGQYFVLLRGPNVLRRALLFVIR